MAVRTKQAIRQAFIELLNERPLDKISVKDIAERSTVNRNTFYYYYADIYALVEEIFQTETQLFMEKLRSYASWEEAFREATAFMSENKRACTTCSTPATGTFWSIIIIRSPTPPCSPMCADRPRA